MHELKGMLVSGKHTLIFSLQTKCLCGVDVFSMPVYDMVEVWLMRTRSDNAETRRVGFFTRFVYRSLYTCFTAMVAITLP